jgi:coatomer protein complex subunit gamma
MLLTSPRGPLRFAAVRTLHSLAAAHPGVVAKCNDDLESLIGDPNKAVATLAITTLLKTSSEGAAAGGSGSTASVDRLIKQIGGFMSEVGSDELKVTVIQAIHELALRMPSKHRALMAFLANALREEGGYEFKKAILDAVMDCMEVIPEAANEGLLHLCEFIEDCEYTALASRVLHTLGDKGPAAPQPAAFIRYIYNRVILENAAVRASAVTALAKFATRCEDLRPSILPLLQRCAEDDDDEVRDRATMYLRMLGGKPTPLTAAAAATGGATPSGGASAVPFESAVSRNLIAGRLPLPVSALAKALTLYAMRPGHGAFSFDALPHVEVPAASLAAAAAAAVTSPSASAGAGSEGGESGASAASAAPLTGWGYSTEIRAAEASAAASKIARAKARLADTGGAAGAVGAGSTAVGSAGASASGGAGGVSAGGSAAAGGAAGGEAGAAEALYRVPEFAAFGPLFRSSRPVELTEAELEYLVTAQKHVFANHVVLQFTIRNTVPEVLLERAAVACAISDPSAYAHVVSIAAQKVREGHPATAYVALARNPDAGVTGVSIGCELRFTSRECDPSTGEPLGDPSPETFPIDGLDISPADYVAPTPVGDFRGSWEAAGADGEVIEQYALSFKTVADAVAAVAETLGLTFCEGTGAVKPGATQHAAYLSGTFLGGVRVLARMQLKLASTVGEVDPVTGVPAPGAAAGGPSSGVLLKIGIRSEDADVSRLLMDCIS